MTLSSPANKVLTGRRGSCQGGINQATLDQHTSYTPGDFGASFAVSQSEGSYPKAWFYPELPWGAPPNWDDKEHRGKTFLRVWDFVLFFACMYVAIAVPYFSGFEDARFEPGMETCTFLDLDRGWKLVRLVLDVLVDLIFFSDIVIGFHTARWEISKKGRPHWKLVDDLKIVRHAYLRGNFALDALGQIPWQYIDCITSDVSTFTKMLRLLRLVKLFRLYRLRRMLEGLYFKYPRSVFAITAIELLGTMALMGHWLCCIWFRIGTASEDGWTTSQDIEDVDGNIIEGQVYYEWITSFYWAITTMTTIGYGDISASTAEERTLAIFVMVLGCAFFAWGTGRITQLLTDTASCSVRFKDKMEELQAYMLSNAMPEDLQERIMSYYMLKFPTMQIFEEDGILEDLPIGLRRRVVWVIFEDILGTPDDDDKSSDGITLFQTCEKETKEDIGVRMKRFYKSAGLDITQAGEIPDGLYIVRFGAVDILANGEVVKTCFPGDVFGENAILGLTNAGRRNRSAKARTICELCFLSKADFLEVLTVHPSFRARMRDLVNAHLRNLSKKLAQGSVVSIKDRTCIDWETVADQMTDMEGKHKQARVVHHAHNALRTTIALTIKNLQLRAPLPASFKTPYAFFAVSWPGTPCAAGMAIPNLHFSRIFALDQVDTEALQKLSLHVHMTILSDDSKWQEKPPVTISLHCHGHSNILRSVSNLGEYVSLEQWMAKNKACKLLAKTTIPIKQLIASRIRSKGQVGIFQAAKALRAASLAPPPQLQPHHSHQLIHEQSVSKLQPGLLLSLPAHEAVYGAGVNGHGEGSGLAHGARGGVEIELRALVSRQVGPNSPWRKVVWSSQHAKGLSADFLCRRYEAELERKKKGMDAVFQAVTLRRAKELRDLHLSDDVAAELEPAEQVKALAEQVQRLQAALQAQGEEAAAARGALEGELREQRQQAAAMHVRLQRSLAQIMDAVGAQAPDGRGGAARPRAQGTGPMVIANVEDVSIRGVQEPDMSGAISPFPPRVGSPLQADGAGDPNRSLDLQAGYEVWA